MTKDEPPLRSIKDFLIISIKGMAMGAADIVPGVSGGTIALITGIYAELLSSLKCLNPMALKILFSEGIQACWRHVNGSFLLALFCGILISIKSLAAVVAWALEYHPLLVWGGFSGLIVASFISLFRQQEKWHVSQWGLMLVGAAFVVLIAIVKPAQVPDHPLMLFFGGFIAICAMILPGISGSFILLLLGLYSVFVRAITDLDVLALLCFAAGCVCGLMAFSQFLSWLLDRWYHNTLAVMLGFLVGSLYVTWPWKQVLVTMIDRHGEEVPVSQMNVLPHQYEALTGLESHVLAVVVSFLIGFGLVLIAEFISKRS
jgi:putative membrane protein